MEQINISKEQLQEFERYKKEYGIKEDIDKLVEHIANKTFLTRVYARYIINNYDMLKRR